MRGNGWQVFGVIVCVFLIVFVVRAILGAISVGISDTFAMRAIFDLLASTLTAPVVALVASVIYFRLKRLEEGGESAPAPIDPGPGPATA